MIPPFNESGYLPPGIHSATLEEIAGRFGKRSELRQVQMESIHWLVALAARAGIRRIILNGSFATDIIEPNDVDCVLLLADDPVDPAAEDELQKGLPFLDIALLGQADFDELVNVTFATDRHGTPKGLLEVIS